MLRIKEGIDLKELEKFGLKYQNEFDRYAYDFSSSYSLGIKIEYNTRIIKLNGGEFSDDDNGTSDIVYDLIKADMVERI